MIVPKNFLKKYDDLTSYTVEEVKSNVDKYIQLFPQMSEEIRGNKDICLKAIMLKTRGLDGSISDPKTAKIFDDCTDKLKQDESFIKDAIEANFYVYGRLSKELKTRKDIVIHASSFGNIFHSLNKTLETKKFESLFPNFKPHPFLDDEEVILSSFNSRGSFGRNDVHGDVQNFGSSFHNASVRLKNDPKFVIIAYKRCQSNLKTFKEKVKANHQFTYLTANKGINCLLSYAAPELFQDKVFVKELLNVSFKAIKYFPEQMKKDANILLSFFWSLSDTKQLKFINHFFKRVVNIDKINEKKLDDEMYLDHLKLHYILLDENVLSKVCEGFSYRVQKAMNTWQHNKPSNQKAVDIYFNF